MLRFVSLVLLIAVACPVRAEMPSFLNEVVPLMTKAGCNQGACHGKGAGQNGFRLSLRGYAPDQDHRWLTREFDARRVDPSEPEASLLLRKATGQAPHEGGKLFGVQSREYQLLRDWLAAGSPGAVKDAAKLTKLEVTPDAKTLKPGETVQLTVWATFADGTRTDVTWLAKFDSNDVAFLTVAPTGLVTAKRNGATAVRVMYQSEVAVAVFAMPFEQTVDAAQFAVKNNFVDEHVFAKLAELRIEPSDLCGDAEFIRRVWLDAAGVLPKPDDVKAFLASTEADKRAKLIDRVLASPAFTDYWALQLGDLFQNRKERDHDVRGVKGVRQFHAWIRKQVADNRPWDLIARDVLLAKGSTTDSPPVGYYIVTVGEARLAEQSEVGESVAQAFLGTRIGCAKCHNHPLERYTQDDFYHFAAFFSRVKLDRKEAKMGGTTALRVSHPDEKTNSRPVGTNQPRTGQFLKPQPLDRSVADIQPTDDPREKLVEWITNPGNAYFSGAMINRVWQHYLGVGLVEPVDDLRATNPPTVPKLWDALKTEFVAHHFDLRHLMRVVLNSRTYQLSSSTRPLNETDARFYSHYYARRLPAEVLHDSIGEATGVPEKLDGYPVGVRAIQVADPNLNSSFLRMFGRSDRVTACACERGGDVTLPQLLHLQNNEALQSRITTATGWVYSTLAAEKSDDAVMDGIFLRTLARQPRDDERAAVRKLLAAGEKRPDVFSDLMWALLNSKEFAFNH
ncbi:DUF1549 domain-containing protein [Limnoglobus roseus]|uniref:BIG2 domain-containing protein n=1 Tax=Limnoglobus roseus TaxID=2598579 RepID=A0A5C1ASC4_9BACT|nr:DUF1549 domain-containing protein [Limnoglobus roseus]QEL20936.1 hypothetical protein PX52LOC_08062 [Limnoglobus roseus]